MGAFAPGQGRSSGSGPARPQKGPGLWTGVRGGTPGRTSGGRSQYGRRESAGRLPARARPAAGLSPVTDILPTPALKSIPPGSSGRSLQPILDSCFKPVLPGVGERTGQGVFKKIRRRIATSSRASSRQRPLQTSASTLTSTWFESPLQTSASTLSEGPVETCPGGMGG